MASASSSIRPTSSVQSTEVRKVTACMACRGRKLAEGVEDRLAAIESVLSDPTIKVAAVDKSTCSLLIQQASTSTESIAEAEDTSATAQVLTCSLGAFPASSVHGILRDSSTSALPIDRQNTIEETVTPDDMLLASKAAYLHFSFFQTKLDSTMYGTLNAGDSIVTVSKRSALLAFAVCATAAYCSGDEEYTVWQKRLQELVIKKTFETRHTFDDVRALCIGALWLDEMASAFSALAVRLASELNLHRCLTKMPHEKLECYDRTRLYFLVCVVDHRCSITFGRPPMTRGVRHGMSPRDLLACQFSSNRQTDVELIAEVELWCITASVFDHFGADIERRSDGFVEVLKQHEARYDKWYEDWSPIIEPVRHLLGRMSDTPFHQTFRLSMLAAKLFLYSHVFRGPGQRQSLPPVQIDHFADLQTLALRAVESALEIVRNFTELIDHYTFLKIMPSYLGLTTAFATVVLHRTSKIPEASSMIQVNPQANMELLTRLRDVLRRGQDNTNTSNRLVQSSARPLNKLARALERLVSSTDTEQNGTATIGDIMPLPHDSFPVDYGHIHSPYAMPKDDVFGFDLVENDLFFGDGFDWPFNE